MEKAIFFDKDGTLIEDVPFNVDPKKINFNKGAFELIQTFKKDFSFHIVSNQAGVALGHFVERDLLNVESKMHEFFSSAGATLSGFHYCPHHPEGTVLAYRKVCDCRKPGIKLIKNAALKFNLDLSGSWLIGDILDDIEAGNNAGMKTILLDVGNETEWDLSETRRPDYRINELREAIPLISKVEQ